MNWGRIIFILACGIYIGGTLMYAFNHAVSLPDVHFSNSTQECVTVVNYAEHHNYSCEHLPNKYYHVWVE